VTGRKCAARPCGRRAHIERGALRAARRIETAQEGAEWLPVAPMSAARGSLAAAAVGGQLFACGGGVPGVQLDLVETCGPDRVNRVYLRPIPEA